MPSDHIHHITSDGTCSRCRKELGEEDVPLMVWPAEADGDDMLIYCEACLGIEPEPEPVDLSPLLPVIEGDTGDLN